MDTETDYGIPKIIYQTCKDKTVPTRMFNAIKSWREMNPDYKYCFFDDDNCRDFLIREFDERVIKAYDNLIPGAYKADLWRYCILYIYGGVYADVKMICEVSLDDIIDSPFVSVRDRISISFAKASIFNAFICSIPRHPFLKRAIWLTVENILNHNYGDSCLDITGPRVLGRAINDILGLPQDHEFSLGKQTINSYDFTLLEHPAEGTKIVKDGKKIIQTKYDRDDNNKVIDSEDSWYQMTGLYPYHIYWMSRTVFKDQ